MAEVRRAYITELPGQDMIYLAKEQEAQAYLAADPEPVDLAPFPFIAGEIGTTGQTAYEVAQVFANLAGLWRAAGAALEAVRMSGPAALEACTTPAEVAAALAAILAEIEALQPAI